MQAVNTDVVLPKREHLEIALLSKGTSKSKSTFREYAVTRKPDLCDVLRILEDFGYMSCSIWPDEVV